MKKSLSLALSIIMIIATLTALPFTALADTVTSKADFIAALADASIAEVKLGADIEINNDDTAANIINLDGTDRTVDLNGHTLTTSRALGAEKTFTVLTKSSGAKLTFTNSSSEGGINSVTSHGFILAENSTNDFVLEFSNINATTASGGQTFFYGNSNNDAKNTIIIKNSSFTVNGGGNKFFIDYKFSDISISNTRFVKTDPIAHIYMLNTDNAVKLVDVLGAGEAVYLGDIKASYDDQTLLNRIYLGNSNVMEIVFKEEVPLVDAAYVKDEAELIAAAGDKDVKSIILSDDISVTAHLDIIVNGNDRVLDLNGHTITVSDSKEMKIKYYTGSKFTINDSSPDGSGTVISGKYDYPIYAYNYMYSSDIVTFVVNGGTYEGSSSDIFCLCNNMHFIVNGGLYRLSANRHLFYSNGSGTVELNKLTIQSKIDFSYAIHEGSFSEVIASDVMPATAKLIYTDTEGVETDVSSNKLSQTYPGLTTLSVVNETEPVQYTVMFHTNGAASIASQTVTAGNTAAEPSEPTKQYYTFGGWYSDEGLTTPFDFAKPITADTDVYAKWTETEHRWSLTDTVDATCTEDGYFLETCLTCGDERKVPIDAYGHDWGEWKVTTPATCEAAGVETRVCDRDKSHTETRDVAALGHTWNAGEITTAPTCVAKGVKTYTCTVCGDTRTEEIAPTGNHTWNAGKVTKKATPTATGVMTYTCTVCGATKTAAIAKCAKYANPLTVKAKKPTVKFKNLKKKNQTIALKSWATVTKAQGKVTCKKSSGNKNITVSKAGKITVKKGLKKGSYKVKIKVTAAGNATYKAKTVTVTVTVKIK